MSRRFLVPLVLGALLLGSGAALADPNGSTEVRTVDRKCSEGGNNQYSAPSGSDCLNPDGNFDPSKTYKAQYYSNDVRCGASNSPSPANPTGIRAYGSQAGGVGVCSEGGSLPVAAPVQGRAGVSGGTSGGKVTIDGDKDNAAPNGNETLRGWATAEVGTAGPKVTCGDEHSQGGRADSDSPQARDSQAECGG